MVGFFERIYKSLKKDGLFVFDLTYCKEKWIEGYVGFKTIIKKDLQVAEIFKSRSKNNISIYNPIYLINDKGKTKFLIDDHRIFLYKIKDFPKIFKKFFKKFNVYGDYNIQQFISSKHRTPIFVCQK